MSNLHGECTPLTLHRLLQIPEIDARKYVGRLIADGVLKPNPVLQEVAQRFARPPKDNLPDQAESPLERATQAHSEQLHLPQDNRETGGVDTKADLPEDPVEADRAIPDASQPLANPEEPEPPQYPSSSPLIT